VAKKKSRKKKARRKAAKKARKAVRSIDIGALLEQLSDAQRELSRIENKLAGVRCLARRVYVSTD
jgi:hypothetical protein